MKDQIGQEIRVGAKAIWTAYNAQWIGHVIKVTAKAVWCQPIPPLSHVNSWRFRPSHKKVMILEDFPKEALMWVLRGHEFDREQPAG